MKKVGFSELFILSEIADQMNFKMPERPETPKDATEMEKLKIRDAYGQELLLTLFKKMHLAQEPIGRLIKNLTGKDPESVGLGEVKDILTQVLKEEGVVSFLKSSVRKA